MPDEQTRKLFDEMLQKEEDASLSAVAPSQVATERSLGIPKRGETFEQRNYAGFPIDVTTGAPGLVRLGVSARDTEHDQLEYLSGIYGKNAARKSDTGEWLVKVVGDDGKPKEVLVNERGLTGRDVMSMAAYAPETVGAMIAIRGGRMIPGLGARKGVTGLIRDVAAEAVGQETAGAVKDFGLRIGSEQALDAPEIAARRLGNVPFDMTIGIALAGAGKVISKAITPLGKPTSIADIEAQEAGGRLGARVGQEMPQTIGEKTGSQAVRRVEATASKLPGSSKYFSDMLAEKTAWMRKTMNNILGIPEGAGPGDVIGTAEDIGEESVNHIRTKLTPMQEAIESSRNTVVKEANDKVLDELASATTPMRQMYPEKTGASVRQKVFNEREAFRAANRKNYGAVPGANDRIHTTPDLAMDAYTILDSLPTQKGGTEPSKLVPDNVVGFLKELASNPNESRSLVDLQTMRGEIDNEIASGQAVPNRQTKFLTEIRGAITKAIDSVVASDPKMKTAYEFANAEYKKNVGKFNDKYIARLFKDIDDGGAFVNDEDIVKNIGPTEFQSFKNVLGANSAEFTNLKRAIADEIYNSALLPGEQLVKGDALIKNLSDFYKKNRSVAEEIFGMKGSELQRLGEIIGAADPKLDADKLASLVRSGEPLSRSIEKLVGEQAKLDKVYRSQILKDIGERRIGEAFNAGEFVNRFYDTASRQEVESVMAQLADNPEAVQHLRQKLIEKVLFQAQRVAKASDPSALGRGDALLPPNSESLRSAIGSLDKRKNLEVVLGPDTYNALLDLGKVVRGSEVSEQAFKAAGGMVSGSQISELLHGGLLGYVNSYVRQKAAAIILSNPVTRWWASKGIMNQPLVVKGVKLAETKEGALMTTLIGSTPFLEAVTDEFGEGTAADQFLTALRRSINMYESTKTEKKPSTAKEQFDQRVFEAKP